MTRGVELALLMIFLAVPLWAQPAGTGRLAGRVTTAQGAALPGVTITLQGPATSVTAVTGADGRFEIETLVDGSTFYTLKAVLPGFRDNTRTRVRATPGDETVLPDIALKAACGDIDLVVTRGFAADAASAALVAHVRIESIATTREWEGEYTCTIANEATAFVLSDAHGGPQRRIGILIPARDAVRYEAGYEAVMALAWDAVAKRYTGWTGNLPVENGAAVLDKISISAGLPARMPVNELLDLVAPLAPPVTK